MPGQLSIREFMPADAADIVDLHEESQECFEEMDVDEAFIQAVAQRVDYRFFIAVKEGNVIGFSGILYHPGLRRAEIGPIAVSKSHRRCEVGKALVEACTAYAKERNIRRLIVKVKANNPGALGFFERLGYAREGFFKEYTKDREDVIQLFRFI